MSDKNSLTLKWGTLKAWNFENSREEAGKLFKQYNEIGSCASAMLQRDTIEQKEIICKLIDLTEEEIYLDWDGKHVSKEDAKEYVMNYGEESWL